MTTKLSSADIKAQLATSTGVKASQWSRWAKYKVGSPSDIKPPKDLTMSFCKGLKFGEHYPHMVDAWVRLYGAPSDQPVTGVAVFEKDGVILDILEITESKRDCGAPQPGRLRDPEGWESWYGGSCENGLPGEAPPVSKTKQIHYNVVTQVGYVESSRPSMLWWSHVGDEGKTGEQLAQELRKLFIEFYSTDFTQKACCSGKKPTKKSKYCDTCGDRLGSKAGIHSDRHQNCVENAIIDLHVGSCDSIMGDCRRNDGYNLDDYLKEQGWEFWHGFSLDSSGPLICIPDFDSYVKSDECWGDLQHNYYEGISEMKVAFSKA